MNEAMLVQGGASTDETQAYDGDAAQRAFAAAAEDLAVQDSARSVDLLYEAEALQAQRAKPFPQPPIQPQPVPMQVHQPVPISSEPEKPEEPVHAG